MTPVPPASRGAARRARLALVAVLAGAATLPSAVHAQSAALASAVPTPSSARPTPAAASEFRIADVGADGSERGWLSADVHQGAGGLAVTVSRSALKMTSANARILAVRAVVVDADTSRGWKVRAASAPVRAASLIGCVDGRLATPVSLVIPAGSDAVRNGRLAFQLVGQVKAPGSTRWADVAERWLAGPVLATR